MPIDSRVTYMPIYSVIYKSIYTAIYGVEAVSGDGATVAPWLPSDMFLNGEQGAWWDYYDDMDHKIAFRRNLLLWSEDFSNAVWNFFNVSGTATRVGNDFTFGASNIDRVSSSNSSVVVGESITASILLSGSGNIRIFVFDGNGAANTSLAITLTSTPTRYTLTRTIANAGANCGLGVYNNAAGTAGASFTATQAQLERGSTATDYQKVTNWNTEFLAEYPNHALFEDSAGSIPVTAVERPLGLVLDKSKGLLLGSDLAVNGSFATDTSWIKGTGWTISGGKATHSGLAGTLLQGLVLTVGATYKVSCTVSGRTAGTCGMMLGSGTTVNEPLTGTNGSRTAYLTAVTGNSTFGITADSAFDGSIDDYTIQLIAGNHLIQATAAARPVLSARKNLLTYTEDFSNAVWVKGADLIVTPNNTTSPDGTLTADKITVNGPATTTLYAFTASSSQFTYTIYTKNSVGTTKNFLIRNTTTAVNQVIGTLDYTTGIITGAGWTAEALADGWFRLSYTVTSGFTIGDNGYLYYGSTAGLPLGDAWYVWGAQLEYGASATTYQRVTTATDYATMGFSFYRSDDGIDDGMATAASVNMSSTDKLAVFVGDANGNTANTGTLIESSPTYLNNAGSFALLVPSLSTSRGSFGSNGGLGGGEKEIQEAPIGQYRKRVITAYNDFATDGDYGCDYIRTNGIPLAGLVGAGNTDVGAGPYGNHTFYTGSRNNTSNRFKGHVHQMVVLGRTPTQEDLDNTEVYIFERQWGTPPPPPVFNPDSLFGVGDFGSVFNISDITTLFQDTAGLVQVTAAGQAVHSIRDTNTGRLYVIDGSDGNNLDIQFRQDSTGSYLYANGGRGAYSSEFTSDAFTETTSIDTFSGIDIGLSTTIGGFVGILDNAGNFYGSALEYAGTANTYDVVFRLNGNGTPAPYTDSDSVIDTPFVITSLVTELAQTIQINTQAINNFSESLAPPAAPSHIYMEITDGSRYYGGVSISRILDAQELLSTQQWCAGLGGITL